MENSHRHIIPQSSEEKPLLYALILTSSFLIAEVMGAYLTGSLALLSDAAHMLTDVVALIIAYVAIRIGRRPADIQRTFGYYRFEILATVFNCSLLFLVSAYIIYEAYKRFYEPVQIESLGMLVIAIIGLFVNLASMFLLTRSEHRSLNIKAAYLEVWSDMLGSLGVIFAAIVIRYTNFIWVDSLIAVMIGIWIIPRTWKLLKESINILLEGVPEGLNIREIKTILCKIDGVVDIHELHIWSITSGKINLTAHVVLKNHDCETILSKIRQVLKSKFNISHTTLQHEFKICLDQEKCHSY